MQNDYADNIFPIGTFLFGTLSLMLAFPKLRAFQLFAARSFGMTSLLPTEHLSKLYFYFVKDRNFRRDFDC